LLSQISPPLGSSASPKIVISSDFARIGRLALKVDSSWRTVV